MPAGAGPANPGPPSPGVYPRCPPPRLASDGALPQRRRLARSASSERQREGPRAAKDGRAGGSRARQPRGPLTRCLSEVPPASARLRRRAPALSRLCRGYQPTIAPWLFEGPRSRSSAKIREIYNTGMKPCRAYSEHLSPWQGGGTRCSQAAPERARYSVECCQEG